MKKRVEGKPFRRKESFGEASLRLARLRDSWHTEYTCFLPFNIPHTPSSRNGFERKATLILKLGEHVHRSSRLTFDTNLFAKRTIE